MSAAIICCLESNFLPSFESLPDLHRICAGIKQHACCYASIMIMDLMCIDSSCMSPSPARPKCLDSFSCLDPTGFALVSSHSSKFCSAGAMTLSMWTMILERVSAGKDLVGVTQERGHCPSRAAQSHTRCCACVHAFSCWTSLVKLTQYGQLSIVLWHC